VTTPDLIGRVMERFCDVIESLFKSWLVCFYMIVPVSLGVGGALLSAGPKIPNRHEEFSGFGSDRPRRPIRFR
jgi:hypothetical protein